MNGILETEAPSSRFSVRSKRSKRGLRFRIRPFVKSQRPSRIVYKNHRMLCRYRLLWSQFMVRDTKRIDETYSHATNSWFRSLSSYRAARARHRVRASALLGRAHVIACEQARCLVDAYLFLLYKRVLISRPVHIFFKRLFRFLNILIIFSLLPILFKYHAVRYVILLVILFSSFYFSLSLRVICFMRCIVLEMYGTRIGLY